MGHAVNNSLVIRPNNGYLVGHKSLEQFQSRKIGSLGNNRQIVRFERVQPG